MLKSAFRSLKFQGLCRPARTAAARASSKWAARQMRQQVLSTYSADREMLSCVPTHSVVLPVSNSVHCTDCVGQAPHLKCILEKLPHKLSRLFCCACRHPASGHMKLRRSWGLLVTGSPCERSMVRACLVLPLHRDFFGETVWGKPSTA